MELIGSFRAKDLKAIYHIPNLQEIYDNAFVANFTENNPDPFKLIQTCRILDNKFKYDKLGMYAITSLANPYNYAATMLYRLYGLPNNTKFSIEWIPLIDACVNSYIMNWPSILSNNLATTITEY